MAAGQEELKRGTRRARSALCGRSALASLLQDGTRERPLIPICAILYLLHIAADWVGLVDGAKPMPTIHLPAVRIKTPARNTGRIIGHKRPLQHKHV
jgi:hypothetical protein